MTENKRDSVTPAAELETGWPKWLLRAQAAVFGMSVGHIVGVLW